jgi:hypothetical protein
MVKNGENSMVVGSGYICDRVYIEHSSMINVSEVIAYLIILANQDHGRLERVAVWETNIRCWHFFC